MSERALERLQECYMRYSGHPIMGATMPDPHEVLKSPTPELLKLYLDAKTVMGRYVSALGAEALDCKEEE